MSLVLDLNDLGVRCYSDGRLLHESPGVALVDSRRLLFGDDALRASRTQPLNTFSRFWSELDVTPINSANRQVRHHVDLAYLHLQHIESHLQIRFAGQDAVIALSGQLDKHALGLLLGIARQLGLNIIGIVDTALASLLPSVRQSVLSHAEIHLHHTVISELELEQQQLRRSRVENLSRIGWLDLQQHLLRYLSGQFIQQCRYNPRHDAASEQLLFDAIPAYLQQAESHRVIECQLLSYSIQVDASELCTEVQGWLAPLNERLLQLSDSGQLYLGDRLSQLGIFLPPDAQQHHLSSVQVSRALGAVGALLPRHKDGVRFTSSLPCNNSASQPQAKSIPATHILYRSRAFPLAGIWSLQPSEAEPLQSGEKTAALAILHNNHIRPTGANSLFLNGLTLDEERPLHQGDRISLSRHGPVLDLITVEG